MLFSEKNNGRGAVLSLCDGAIIPIIAMTENAFAEDVKASLDAGMNGHLSKPIVIDEIVKTIEKNLNKSTR